MLDLVELLMFGTRWWQSFKPRPKGFAERFKKKELRRNGREEHQQSTPRGASECVPVHERRALCDKHAVFATSNFGAEGRSIAVKKVFAHVAFASCVFPVCAQQTENTRLKESYEVLRDIQGAGDKGIPADLLKKAECV